MITGRLFLECAFWERVDFGSGQGQTDSDIADLADHALAWSKIAKSESDGSGRKIPFLDWDKLEPPIAVCLICRRHSLPDENLGRLRCRRQYRLRSCLPLYGQPVYNITKFGLRALSQSISAEGAGKVRSFTVSTGFVKTPLALNQIPAQAKQRGITPEEVVTDVMMGKSRIKEMMSPIEVGNLFVFGFSRFARYLIGGDLLFDGGMVLTY